MIQPLEALRELHHCDTETHSTKGYPYPHPPPPPVSITLEKLHWTLWFTSSIVHTLLKLIQYFFFLVLKSRCLLITKYCQTETSNLSKQINSNYLFYHLFDKNIRSSFFVCMNESRQSDDVNPKLDRGDVNPKLDLLLKNVSGSTKININ